MNTIHVRLTSNSFIKGKLSMTKLEHAALEYLKAIESDVSVEQQTELEKARGNVLEAAILWAQEYEINKVKQKKLIDELLNKRRENAKEVFTNCEFLPGDPCPIVPVYENGRRGMVLGEVPAPDDVSSNEFGGFDVGFAQWWKVRFDGEKQITLQWPPTLTTKGKVNAR